MRIPIKTISFFALFITLILCAIIFQEHLLQIIAWIKELGWWAPVLFVSIYCLASLLFLPTLVLTFAGGALFGPVFGVVYNLAGALAGATVSFLITRHFLPALSINKHHEKLNKIINDVNDKGWVVVALLRLFPIIPFNLVNYGLGITNIKFRVYLLATFIFLIPPEIIYTYCGYIGIDLLTLLHTLQTSF